MTAFTHVDTHCHVDAYKKPSELLEEAARAGVVVVAMSELPSSFRRFRTLMGRRAVVRHALGVHPLRAHRFTPSERRIFRSELSVTDYIGEVGLDYSRNHPDRMVQRETFEWIVSHAGPRKVLSIHSRRAERDVIDTIDGTAVAPILHWFSGPLSLLDEALRAGCYFSINPAMIRTKKGRALLQALPMGRVLTETDGPYCKTSTREARPRDVIATVDTMASILGVDSEEVRANVWSNMSRLASSVREAS